MRWKTSISNFVESWGGISYRASHPHHFACFYFSTMWRRGNSVHDEMVGRIRKSDLPTAGMAYPTQFRPQQRRYLVHIPDRRQLLAFSLRTPLPPSTEPSEAPIHAVLLGTKSIKRPAWTLAIAAGPILILTSQESPERTGERGADRGLTTSSSGRILAVRQSEFRVWRLSAKCEYQEIA